VFVYAIWSYDLASQAIKGLLRVTSTAVKPRLLDQVREKIRVKHYSIRTEQAYVDWIRRFIVFHGKRHPAERGAGEVERFLSHLAVERNVAASTQNQALSAILFLYKEVLGTELPWLDGVERARKPARLPVVLSVTEVRAILARLEGKHALMASLLYGAGLRLMECVRLRVKDVDFEYRQITVRDGKGHKDRVTMVPEKLLQPLQAHLEAVKVLHQQDLAQGYGEVYLPYALERKHPAAGKEWAGSMSFPRQSAASIRVRVCSVAIMWTSRACSVRSSAPFGPRA
jgi:integron integrase